MEGVPATAMRFSDRIDINPLAFSILFALLCRDDKALREGAPVRTWVSARIGEDREMDGRTELWFGSAHF